MARSNEHVLDNVGFTLVISPDINSATGALDDLGATVTGGEAATLSGDMSTELVSVNKATGLVSVQAVDTHIFELAATGLAGNWLLYAIAGLLAVMGVSVFVAYRRREKDED